MKTPPVPKHWNTEDLEPLDEQGDVMDDDFADEVIDPQQPSGITALERIERLKAQVLSQQTIIALLLERHYSGADDLVAEVNSNGANIFRRIMDVEGNWLLSAEVYKALENFASEIHNKLGFGIPSDLPKFQKPAELFSPTADMRGAPPISSAQTLIHMGAKVDWLQSCES